MPVKAKVIFPKSVLADPRKLVRALENKMSDVAYDIKADFDVTTQTWQNRPAFVIQKSPFKRLIYTRSDIYRFVSRGTRVRYAVMTPGFRPKTRVGYLGSNKGAGGLAFVGKVPLPGIQAREFEQVIEKKWQKLAPPILQRAIDAEFNQ